MPASEIVQFVEQVQLARTQIAQLACQIIGTRHLTVTLTPTVLIIVQQDMTKVPSLPAQHLQVQQIQKAGLLM